MNEPARILYICHDGALYGSQQSLLLILQHLPREYWQPFVAIARPGAFNDRLAQDLPDVAVAEHRRVQWFKHDRRTPLQTLGDRLVLLLTAIPRAYKLFWLIREHRISLVHSNSVVSLEGALAAWLAGVPHVWHIRELFMRDNPKLHPVLDRALTRWLVVTLSQRVVCISQAVQSQFEPYLASQSRKFSIVYNAIAPTTPSECGGERDDQQQQPAISPRRARFRFGYAGRLSEGKRFHDLLHALLMAQQHLNQPLELLVAGDFVDSPYRERVQAMVEDLNLAEWVTFLGYQPRLDAFFEAIDVLVLTSQNEPFGRVLIEAMRAGVPCIAANAGGVPEIIAHGHTGLLYPPGDLAALARILAEAVQTPVLLAKIQETAGRMVVERFTIEEQMEALAACYRDLRNRRPTNP